MKNMLRDTVIVSNKMYIIMVSIDTFTCFWSTAHGFRSILNQSVFNTLEAPITSFGVAGLDHRLSPI